MAHSRANETQSWATVEGENRLPSSQQTAGTVIPVRVDCQTARKIPNAARALGLRRMNWAVSFLMLFFSLCLKWRTGFRIARTLQHREPTISKNAACGCTEGSVGWLSF
jgi:hypothetical protein